MHFSIKGLVASTIETVISQYYKWRNFKPPVHVDWTKIRVIAHRGSCGEAKLENSLNAFDQCLEFGLDGIEFDVRWTKDDQPVVHHDLTLKRLFNDTRKVSDFTLDQLRQHHPEIPFLSEVVERFQGRMHFMIELKDPDQISNSQMERLIQVLSPLQAQEEFHLMSLKPAYLKALPFDDRCKVGISITNVEEVSESVKTHRLGMLSGAYFLFSNELIQQHRNAHRGIGTGFICNESIANYEVARGVNWLFTNDGRRIAEHIQQQRTMARGH